MRTKLLASVFAVGLVMTGSTISAQNAPVPPTGTQPAPGEGQDPANPSPMPDPANPNPPVTEPLPPEMPMPAGEAQQMPPQQPSAESPDAPMEPMATPPAGGQTNAVSGSTTRQMTTPQPATKEYPVCSRTVQDSCINPGERAGRRPR